MCAIMGFTSPTLKEETMRPFFDRTLSRGPDQTRVEPAGKGWLCFHRLAIMGLSEEGMQPFHLGGDMVVCNGEIYGFRKLRAQLAAKYTFRSESDCEILLPLYREYGLEMFKMLDAEFAMILYDAQTRQTAKASGRISSVVLPSASCCLNTAVCACRSASGMAAYFSSRASTCLAMGLIFFSSRSEKLPKSFSTRDIGNTS